MTIGFNDIELIIRVYTAFFLGPHEAEMGKIFSATEVFFRQRKDLFEAILGVLKTEYPDLLPQIAAVSSFVAQGDKLSVKRNSIVHGTLLLDGGIRTMGIVA